jgi:hypothetical protein
MAKSAVANPPARPETTEAEIDQLLHPGRFYDRPSDVAADALLTIEERRAILSSWASDACAVHSTPALRQAPFAAEPVTFDEIMDALLSLDRQGQPGSGRSIERIIEGFADAPSTGPAS